MLMFILNIGICINYNILINYKTYRKFVSSSYMPKSIRRKYSDILIRQKTYLLLFSLLFYILQIIYIYIYIYIYIVIL